MWEKNKSSVKSIRKCKKSLYNQPKPYFFKKILWSHFWIDFNKFYIKTFGIVNILIVYLLIMLLWVIFIGILLLFYIFLSHGNEKRGMLCPVHKYLCCKQINVTKWECSNQYKVNTYHYINHQDYVCTIILTLLSMCVLKYF
jgi:hypothetical protein